MTSFLGIQLTDALHEVWSQTNEAKPHGLQWELCKLTMQLNAVLDEQRTNTQVLDTVTTTLSECDHPAASAWAKSTRGFHTTPSADKTDIWSLAEEIVDREGLNSRTTHPDGLAALVIWWPEGRAPQTPEYSHGPDRRGRQWTLSKLLWRRGQATGAVISWGPSSMSAPAARAWAGLRTEIKDQILEDLTRLGTPHPFKSLEAIASNHICRSPSCSGPEGHRYDLLHKMLLPESLDPLVTSLGLDCDLLADGLHRHRKLKHWCSKYTVDKRAGAEGNALTVPLNGRRMLIHLPPTGLWRNHLGKRIMLAVGQSTDTLCLILSPHSTGVSETLPPESLLLLGHSDSPGLGDPSGMFKKESTGCRSGRMQLWVCCQTPTRQHTRTRWSALMEAARRWVGFVASPQLIETTMIESRAQELLSSLHRSHARATAMQEILALVRALSEEEGPQAESTRRHLRTKLISEASIRRQARESISDLAALADTHLLALGPDWTRPIPRRQPHWRETPSLDPSDEASVWMNFVKSMGNVCGYTKEDWPPLALSSRHDSAYWLIWWRHGRNQHSAVPTLFDREPGARGSESNRIFICWHLDHALRKANAGTQAGSALT